MKPEGGQYVLQVNVWSPQQILNIHYIDSVFIRPK